MKEKTTCIILN